MTKKLLSLLLLLGGLFLSPALGLHAQAEEISSPQKLRVGYYAYTGFNMIDADGSYSGYSYELLQKIARYRNVIYEYDGYDGNVSAGYCTAHIATADQAKGIVHKNLLKW